MFQATCDMLIICRVERDPVLYMSQLSRQFSRLWGPECPEFLVERILYDILDEEEDSSSSVLDYVINDTQPIPDFNSLDLDHTGEPPQRQSLQRQPLELPESLVTTEPYHADILGRFIKRVEVTLGRSNTVDVMKRLLLLRRISRELNEFIERIVEHPSKKDRDGLLSRLKSEENASLACRTYEGSSGERLPANKKRTKDNPEWKLHSQDIQDLQSAQNEAQKYDQSSDRLLGVVWASSGKSTKKEPKHGKEDDIENIKQDWALIKIFPGVRAGVENTFNANILRPKRPSQPFVRVKPWPFVSKYSVYKRGRTTDYTTGYVNSCLAAGKCEDGQEKTLEYQIYPTMTNGLFSMSGDSGSWVMDRCGQLIGMAWGKSKSSGGTLFTPACYLFSWIGQAFEEAMRKDGVVLTDEIEPGQRVQLFSPVK